MSDSERARALFPNETRSAPPAESISGSRIFGLLLMVLLFGFLFLISNSTPRTQKQLKDFPLTSALAGMNLWGAATRKAPYVTWPLGAGALGAGYYFAEKNRGWLWAWNIAVIGALAVGCALPVIAFILDIALGILKGLPGIR